MSVIQLASSYSRNSNNASVSDTQLIKYFILGSALIVVIAITISIVEQSRTVYIEPIEEEQEIG